MTRHFAWAALLCPLVGVALSLNIEMRQVITNLIWRPSADRSASGMPFGRLDVGLEDVVSRCDPLHAAASVGPCSVRCGIANWLPAAGIVAV